MYCIVDTLCNISAAFVLLCDNGMLVPKDQTQAIAGNYNILTLGTSFISKKTRFCILTHLNEPCTGVCIWSASCASHESCFELQKPKWTCKYCPLGLKIHVCLRNC